MKKNHCIYHALFLSILLLALSGNAQIISIKSLPVATGNQFAYLPTENNGMGGLSFSISDKWLDPFINPAKGVKTKSSWLYTAPYFYRIQNNMGRARSLPVGMYFSGDPTFGGIAISMQNFDPQSSPGSSDRLSDRSANNIMITGVLGYKINKKLSIGAGVSYADLEAMDGVQMLYAWNDRVEQEGNIKSGRLAALYQAGQGREAEFILVHQRTDMTHEIYRRIWWDWMPILPTEIDEKRTELDRHRLWGGSFIYRTPIGSRNWTLSLGAAYNRKTHPKIPNYDIMRIPRDPGYSNAFQMILGLSKTKGPVTFGCEIVTEPISSKTWTEAIMDTQSVNGHTIMEGGRTIVNTFKFKNLWYRMGLKRNNDKWGFQLGMQWRNINYKLNQIDHINETERDQKESWLEWSFTWGLSLKYPEFDIVYHGQLMTGGGLPGINNNWQFGASATLSNDFIVAPAGAMSLQDANVMTHRITCVIPL
ncbi:hypothetical protein KAR48_06125 [bacterium]|nr:hypothetical protein [bacterium]